MKVFLSPAQHHKNCLADGCSEAIHCNQIADAMEPYLEANGIDYLRNDKNTEKPMDHVRKANAWGADVYLALHTNAGGGKRCTFYNSGSIASQEYSLIFADNYRKVYPNLVKPSENYPPEVCRESWTELIKSDAPAVYAELWFHDNLQDAAWGHKEIEETAKTLVKAICEIFAVPFMENSGENKEQETYDGIDLMKIARVVAAESRGEPYEGQKAVAQCIRDRWQDPGKRFGKNMAAVLTGFAKPWAGDLEKTTCMDAAREVMQGASVFGQPCLWCLSGTAKKETFENRNSKYIFLGKIVNQWFWGDDKEEQRNLAKGDTGEDVEDLQIRLIDLGYQLPKFGADGEFGTETDQAVRNFQQDKNIAVDGIVGQETRAALDKAEKDEAKEKTYTVQKGDTLTKIARAHGTTWSKLKEINGITDASMIHPGQIIKLEGQADG